MGLCTVHGCISRGLCSHDWVDMEVPARVGSGASAANKRNHVRCRRPRRVPKGEHNLALQSWLQFESALAYSSLESESVLDSNVNT